MTDNDTKLVAVIAATLDNAEPILKAFEQVGADDGIGFTLAACCAMVEMESGGSNVWGHDEWNPRVYPRGPALPEQENGTDVTEQNYHRYKLCRNSGMQPQGCGPAQLTSPELQEEAEDLGGCWIPYRNLTVGFRYLRTLMHGYGDQVAGFAAYNGSGAAADAYGQQAAAKAQTWQERINAALNGGG